MAAPMQIAASAIDGKLVLDGGAVRVVNHGERDAVVLYDLAVFPPRELCRLPVPASLAGPPQSVAVSPDQTLVVVTAAQRTDPADATRTVPDTRISVVRIDADGTARVAQTLDAGLGPTGVSFSPDGRTVVVANRHDGTLSTFRVAGGALVPLATVTVGDAACQPASAAFTPDGRGLLVSRDGDHFVSVFDVADDGAVTHAGRDISAGLKPYGLCVAGHGRFAVVGNVGRVSGDADSISVIDLTRRPWRVVDTLGVAATPECVAISPDAAWVVVVCHHGSTRAEDSPLFNPQGRLVVFRVGDDDRLVRHAEHPIGRWAQGAAFSHDGGVLLVQNTVEGELQVFRVGPDGLADSGVRLSVGVGSCAAIRTVDFPRRAR